MAAHPYSPADLDLPGYVPQHLSQFEIVARFYVTALFGVLAVWFLSGRCRGLSKEDRLRMCWWALTGPVHLVIERAFLFNPAFFTKSSPNYFDELWKEYSKGDSRYITRDSIIIAMEGLLVLLVGPGSLLSLYAIASRKSYNQILQFTVCLGHLAAGWFYIATAYLDGFNFWASPYYFWAYFIGANGAWVVIPFIIATRIWKKISIEIHQAEKMKSK